ncbi:(2,3-dihydroxybenzoyl)adenylate synthase [Conexibacter woesei]|uniref:AMP-dependent synthetase and ligase n=1 Tax=Conexibacter woesei (strain DSM 14684 / CCUG 47730 / CIP 108061 / JCM 11494 / NBRC 100937 / ID131577) TaxID=469383 RepID=D3FAS2_CONWI|nr:AMP-binding protein [Conexibacter woesei]ADB51235.1 AMP-dependent synthetase and ligase [Conexibacter woesei DSM 14684]
MSAGTRVAAQPRGDGLTPWPADVAARYRREGWWSGTTCWELLEDAVRHAPERIAVVDGPRRISYAAVEQRALGIAGGLRDHGLERGDRVVVQLPNRLAFVELTLALLRIGALPVMALPAHRDHEIGHLLALSGAVAYAGPRRHRSFDHVAMAGRLRADAPALRLLLCDEPADGAVDLEALAAVGRAADASDPAPAPGDVALLLLSGGTTGLPKLIPRTHDDYVYNARASAELCGFDASTVYLVALPASHNFPLACPGILGALAVGGRVVLTEDAAPAAALPLIEREHVTATALVPALLLRWLESPLRERADLGSLRLVQVGGARLAAEVARRVRLQLGATLQQVFGMAEGLLNYTRLDDPEEVLAETQGRPLCPGDELRIVDPDGRTVADGEEGELHVRGPYTLRGYYRAAEHNARAFTPDGYYRTGDVVRWHASGNLVVAGRAKDLINRGGEKISAEEIENLILGHAAVETCAAVAMPDEEVGERTCAYVVVRDGHTLDLPALVAFLRERRIASFKLPERLEVVRELPLTNVGKVDKQALRTAIRARLARERAGDDAGAGAEAAR